MPLTDSKRKANRKWREKAYDKICLQYPKGTRDAWKQEAERRGMSLAGFILAAVKFFLRETKN